MPNEEINALIRYAFGKGPQAEAEAHAQHNGEKVEALDKEIEERERALDALVRQRDRMLFEKEDKSV